MTSTTTVPLSPRHVSVAIVEDDELMVAGWRKLLACAPTQRYHVATGDSAQAADVTLYGLSRTEATDHDLALHLLLRTTGSTVIVTHWEDTPSGVEGALRCGAHGALSRRLGRPALLAGIEAIRTVGRARDLPSVTVCHPEIAETGLTQREIDVLCLVAGGLTNQQIAERLYLSINTVKTYIRCGYRKIGVERRAQAVAWAQGHDWTASARVEMDAGSIVEQPGPRGSDRAPALRRLID